MIVNKEFDDKVVQKHPRVFRLRITRSQEEAVLDEARRWDMIETDMLQFILRWGFHEYFRR